MYCASSEHTRTTLEREASSGFTTLTVTVFSAAGVAGSGFPPASAAALGSRTRRAFSGG